MRQVKQHALRISASNVLLKSSIRPTLAIASKTNISMLIVLSPEDQNIVDNMFEDHNMDNDGTVPMPHTSTDSDAESTSDECGEFSELANGFAGW